jgi:hypothetical protein
MTTMITTSRLTTSTLHQFLATRRNTTTMMLLWPRRPNLNTPPNFGIYWPYHQTAASSKRAASLNWDHHHSRPTVAATVAVIPFTLRPHRHESQFRLATVTRSALSRHSRGLLIMAQIQVCDWIAISCPPLRIHCGTRHSKRLLANTESTSW